MIGVFLGRIKNGISYNPRGEQIGKFDKQDLVDYKGHRLGRIGGTETFYDDKGVIVFTIEKNSKGDECKVFDPQEKIIATVHENHKTRHVQYIAFRRRYQPINAAVR